MVSYIFLLFFVIFNKFSLNFSFKINQAIISKQDFNNKFQVSTKINHQYEHKIQHANALYCTSQVEQGVGVEGCKLPSPSRINTFSPPLQALSFISISSLLYLGTLAILSGFSIFESLNPDLFASWKNTFSILGLFFIAAGISHFPLKKEFINIYPSPGAWGFWYLPGSADFHVAWTGIAEFILGLGLIIGSILNVQFSNSSNLSSLSALGLLLLTIAVTPANIFMLTHGARLPMSGPPVGIQFHVIRLLIQCLLFAQFYTLAQPTISLLFK